MCDRVAVQTLLIVDDHAGFRTIARAALGGAYQVVGEAGDAAGARELARTLQPDVVLLDVQLPDGDGLAVASELLAEDDRLLVVVTSSRDRSDIEPLLLGTAIRGFIPKEDLSAPALAAMTG